MKIKISIALLLIILTIGAVSATDENINSDNLTVSEDLQLESSIDVSDEISSDNNEGTFKELSNLIKNTPYCGNLKLDKDYINDNSLSNEAITISQPITIDGDNHILNAEHASNIFNIKSKYVVLKNIIFKNGYSTSGGAITYGYGYDNYCDCCIIDNCTFIDCHATDSGAIQFNRGYEFSDGGTGYKYGCSNCNVNNCNFINCSAKNNGGAMCFYDETDNGIISNCNFINCSAKNGGAVHFYDYMTSYSNVYHYSYYNSNGVIQKCSFSNCAADYGGAIYIGREYDDYLFARMGNSTVINCEFMNCSANIGGSIYWKSIQGKIENSIFTSSHAKNGGAVYADENIDLAITNSNFKDNAADEFGSAVYGGVTSNCSFSGNSVPEIYDSYNPELKLIENAKITYCPISMRLPRDTTGNFSLYIWDGENYTFVDCVKIKDNNAEIYFKSPKLGAIKIKTITDTNYGVFESYGQLTITAIEFEDSEYGCYLNSIYTVNIKLPEDAKGNFSLYVDNELYECVNLTNGRAAIPFITLKAGKYNLKAVCNSNYGFENATKDVEFEDGSDMYMWIETIFYNDAGKISVSVIGINGEIVGKGTAVNIKIGSTTFKPKTNADGVATVNIPKLKPGKYTVIAKYKNIKLTEKLTVKHIVTLKTVKVKRSAKKLTLQATLKNKKPIKGKLVTFKFAGKTYKAKTNSKGIAKVNIYSKILKKLKAGKKVTYQATYLKDTVKKTAKVQK